MKEILRTIYFAMQPIFIQNKIQIVNNSEQ